jgi:uncharacterized protein YnzC (UPF0291/DUF896 family)
MNMNDVIARINELAKKAKTEGLTPEETAERDKLRRIYIDSVKANLIGQLDNTYIVDQKGNKTPLSKRDK